MQNIPKPYVTNFRNCTSSILLTSNWLPLTLKAPIPQNVQTHSNNSSVRVNNHNFEAKDYSLFIPKASSCRRKQSLVQKKKEEQVFLNDISIEIRFFMKII